MRIHAGQLSLFEANEPPIAEQSQEPNRAARQVATRSDKPAETTRPQRRRGRTKRPFSAAATNGAALLTTEEAALLLHVHARTVQRLVVRGDLNAVHLGGAVRFDPQDVQGLIERVKCRAANRARGDDVRPRRRSSRATVPSGSFRDRIGSSRS